MAEALAQFFGRIIFYLLLAPLNHWFITYTFYYVFGHATDWMSLPWIIRAAISFVSGGIAFTLWLIAWLTQLFTGTPIIS